MKAFFDLFEPLDPVETGEAFALNCDKSEFSNIKAVIFDIYGTLLISDSGDIGGVYHGVKHALEVLEKARFVFNPDHLAVDIGKHVVNNYLECIEIHHKDEKAKGNSYPEVVIEKIWEQLVEKLVEKQLVTAPEKFDCKELAMHFEFLNNPTYPMPGMEESLKNISEMGLELGIVSNAQYFTPMLLKFFMNQEITEGYESLMYFNPDLQVYSYLEGKAKPGFDLYQKMAAKLKEKGILPEESLFVGNDMLNDIYASKSCGFKTALFAGDRRSLRLRVDHPKLEGVDPDVVITDLRQLKDLLQGKL